MLHNIPPNSLHTKSTLYACLTYIFYCVII
nr:MAG TPA: hypothetical protein [Caudoviricetes sp.]DAJ42100.1 MAG TPA: hypothetical protein [Caudoviricetes sp.]DAT81966.1 MAG TPA: hypothetical protein [Caudoviricetes sp.]DAZ00310.1 MAG TPA: hypothetical protein [Caudoviricetes sp.]